MTFLAVYGWDPPTPAGGTGDKVPFEHVGPYQGLRPDASLWVFQDAASWSAFWYAYMPSSESTPAPPAFNFTQNTVVVLSQGMRGSSGYSLNVTAVYHDGAGLLVEAQESDPGDGCGGAAILTWLYDIVKVPKIDGPVSVLLHWDSVPCPES